MILNQEYQNYISEDFEVWKVLFERQMKKLPDVATKSFLDGLQKINFTSDKIPNFEEVNPLLKKITGWQLTVVPGLIDNKPFFEFLHNKYFCATNWLRKREFLDYLEEPDMFHDVFGHVPLLTNQSFVDFLQQLAKIALEHIDNNEIIEYISRIYWYTVEFGLIKESNGLKIYGAGILSSAGESDYCLKSNLSKRVPYNVEEIINTPYIKDHFQEKYFVIDSYDQLFNSVHEIERQIQNKISI